MTKFQLASCDNFFPPDVVTYHHQSLGHKKFNDHFIVSQSLITDTHLSKFSILDDGDNLSDHFPITMNLSLQVETRDFIPTNPILKPKLKWAKITDSQKDQYTERLKHLEQITPLPLLQCQKACRCRNAHCCNTIQGEYDFLVKCLKMADYSLPRFEPGREKDWWSDEFTDLRNKSISSLAEGRPRQGL